ncbi:DUF4405 domain-containing protein [Methanolobus sp. ZRKC3]|uniref:DUF4405 domain-containing protein n=1 Tax=Methanolobus sp. ZRKC3 TaxID=3125786 RepID=UPI003254A0B2
MNRAKLNYLLDLLLTMLFIIVAFTGFFMYVAIPGGVPRGRYQEYMGISKATWTLIHNRSSIMFTIGIALHVILHKRWISCITATLLNKRENEQSCKIDEN